MQTIPQSNTATPDERVPVSMRLLKSLDRAVEILAAHRDWSKQAFIEEAIRAYIESVGGV